MNQKQLRERLRAARVINEWDLAKIAAAAGTVGVFARYRPPDYGRASQSAAWQVIRPGYKTDPNAHWSDHGNKTFTIWSVREQKDEKRLEATGWASERYGLDPEDWVPSPFGRGSGWFPRGVLDAALRAIEQGAHLSQQDGKPVIPAQEGGDLSR